MATYLKAILETRASNEGFARLALAECLRVQAKRFSSRIKQSFINDIRDNATPKRSAISEGAQIKATQMPGFCRNIPDYGVSGNNFKHGGVCTRFLVIERPDLRVSHLRRYYRCSHHILAHNSISVPARQF